MRAVAALAEKVSYVVDPDNALSGEEYTGPWRIKLKRRILEDRQAHLRASGAQASPLHSRRHRGKFRGNCAFGRFGTGAHRGVARFRGARRLRLAIDPTILEAIQG